MFKDPSRSEPFTLCSPVCTSAPTLHQHKVHAQQQPGGCFISGKQVWGPEREGVVWVRGPTGLASESHPALKQMGHSVRLRSDVGLWVGTGVGLLWTCSDEASLLSVCRVCARARACTSCVAVQCSNLRLQAQWPQCLYKHGRQGVCFLEAAPRRGCACLSRPRCLQGPSCHCACSLQLPLCWLAQGFDVPLHSARPACVCGHGRITAGLRQLRARVRSCARTHTVCCSHPHNPTLTHRPPLPSHTGRLSPHTQAAAHTHSLLLSHTVRCSHTHSPQLTHTLSAAHTHSPQLTHTVCCSHTQSAAHTHSPQLTHTVCCSHTQSAAHTHSLLLTHTVRSSHTVCCSHTQSDAHTHSPMLTHSLPLASLTQSAAHTQSTSPLLRSLPLPSLTLSAACLSHTVRLAPLTQAAARLSHTGCRSRTVRLARLTQAAARLSHTVRRSPLTHSPPCPSHTGRRSPLTHSPPLAFHTQSAAHGRAPCAPACASCAEGADADTAAQGKRCAPAAEATAW